MSASYPGYTLLLIMAGNRSAVWSSPTNRFFVGQVSAPVSPLIPYGFTKLHLAIQKAAEVEAAQRLIDKGDAKSSPTWKQVRDVLWETQPTDSAIHAPRRVHLAISAALTFHAWASPATPRHDEKGGQS